VPDRRLVEEIAADLGTAPGLVEKDWHVVRALAVIAQMDPGGMRPAFSGGTSLSKGWELIKRFSEDIDFKIGEPAASSAGQGRRARTAYRERVLAALNGGGFELLGKPIIGNESSRESGFVRCSLTTLGARTEQRRGRLEFPHWLIRAWMAR
jgi:hypothetical protein